MQYLSKLLCLLAIAALALGSASAETPKINLNEQGVALEGFDPVAYFEVGKPMKGSSAHTATHDGATYHFASKAHLDLFQADPAKYVPAYGGYCAYGMRYGHTSRVDPYAWRIVDGKLYLQLNHGTQAVWLTRVKENIEIADGVWKRLIGAP
jgi:YHS domain-containing protein